MIFLNSVSSAAALVFYLPGVCTHTETEGKQSPKYFQIFEINTIFNEHPVYDLLNLGKERQTDKIGKEKGETAPICPSIEFIYVHICLPYMYIYLHLYMCIYCLWNIIIDCIFNLFYNRKNQSKFIKRKLIFRN